MRKKMSSDQKMFKAKVVGNFTYQEAESIYYTLPKGNPRAALWCLVTMIDR